MNETMEKSNSAASDLKDTIFVNAAFIMNDILYNASCVAEEENMPLIMMERVCKKSQKEAIKHLRVMDRTHVTVQEEIAQEEAGDFFAAGMAAYRLGLTDDIVTVTANDISVKVSLT